MSGLPFELTGMVTPGKKLGSKLGFPTANIAYDPDGRSWPREGVYAGVARVEGESRSYAVILNQGRHPTAPGGMPTVEAHLLGYPERPLYGSRLQLSYRVYLRSEKTFPSLDALKEQLIQDRQSAIDWASRCAPELLEPLTSSEGVCNDD